MRFETATLFPPPHDRRPFASELPRSFLNACAIDSLCLEARLSCSSFWVPKTPQQWGTKKISLKTSGNNYTLSFFPPKPPSTCSSDGPQNPPSMCSSKSGELEISLKTSGNNQTLSISPESPHGRIAPTAELKIRLKASGDK